MNQPSNRPVLPTPKRCGSYKDGHETHYIPATKVFVNEELFPVEIQGPVEDGWFTVSDRATSERWWHHDAETLARLFPGSAKRVGITTYLVVNGQWINGALEATECPVWVDGVAVPRLKPV